MFIYLFFFYHKHSSLQLRKNVTADLPNLALFLLYVSSSGQISPTFLGWLHCWFVKPYDQGFTLIVRLKEFLLALGRTLEAEDKAECMAKNKGESMEANADTQVWRWSGRWRFHVVNDAVCWWWTTTYATSSMAITAILNYVWYKEVINKMTLHK